MPDLSDKVSELAPCPFCGDDAELCEAEECGPDAYVVSCTNSNCMASSKVIYALKGDVKELLVEAWNRRTRPPASSMEGWRIVPEEMTLAMSAAGEAEYTRKGLGVWSDFHAIYRAMLAASPIPPEVMK